MSLQSGFQHARREFFTTSAAGLGGLALTSMFADDGLLGAPAETPSLNPLDVRPPPFAPRAKRCILIFLAGAPSPVDLYDPKTVRATMGSLFALPVLRIENFEICPNH